MEAQQLAAEAEDTDQSPAKRALVTEGERTFPIDARLVEPAHGGNEAEPMAVEVLVPPPSTAGLFLSLGTHVQVQQMAVEQKKKKKE
eukprot:gene4772-7599_t